MNLARLSTVVLALAMTCTMGFCGYGVGRYKLNRAQRGWSIVSVVTATHDLPAGSLLTRTDLQVSRMPEPLVTNQQLTDFEVEAAIGATLDHPLAAGAMVRRDFVWPPVGERCLELAQAAAKSASLTEDPEVVALLATLDGGAR